MINRFIHLSSLLRMKLHYTAFALTIIGALNWGLMGVGQLFSNSDWNAVAYLFGQTGALGSHPIIGNIVYILIGLSALVLIFSHKKDCMMCGSCKTESTVV
jgi:uncharacterized membrane protein YuzA (DUF378 family)